MKSTFNSLQPSGGKPLNSTTSSHSKSSLVLHFHLISTHNQKVPVLRAKLTIYCLFCAKFLQQISFPRQLRTTLNSLHLGKRSLELRLQSLKPEPSTHSKKHSVLSLTQLCILSGWEKHQFSILPKWWCKCGLMEGCTVSIIWTPTTSPSKSAPPPPTPACLWGLLCDTSGRCAALHTAVQTSTAALSHASWYWVTRSIISWQLQLLD